MKNASWLNPVYFNPGCRDDSPSFVLFITEDAAMVVKDDKVHEPKKTPKHPKVHEI